MADGQIEEERERDKQRERRDIENAGGIFF
jgi:hypothetical protein